MKVLLREEPRTIALVSDTHALTFRQQTSPAESSKRSSSVEVQLEKAANFQHNRDYKVLIHRDLHGCLGLIELDKQIYVALISGASINVARPVPYESVDNIYSVDFVSLSSNDWDFVNLDSAGMPLQTQDPDEFDPNSPRVVHPCFELKKLLSNGSFYFSNDFDLTSSVQKRGVDATKFAKGVKDSEKAASITRVNLSHYEEQYMWNSFMMEELFKFRANLDEVAVEILDHNRFLTTVIRGFAKTVRLNSRGDTISIISKQSWRRAGTRFNARGIDDDGNVANFVESEFIFNNVSSRQVFAFTQIRGSVPTFWEQDSTLINPKITITRSREASQLAFNKHFDEVCEKYGVCHIVNLLSKTKSQEVNVSRCYKELLDHSPHKKELSYSHFDFHAETKQSSGGFAGATKILPSLYDSLEQFGWFNFDVQENEVITRQDGVFRVNCLDCLDRTNLIEQVISQRVLSHILQNQMESHGNSPRDKQLLDELTLKHNTLWADNGDAISQIYTGTNALKSSFSRSGKMNFAGALSDVTKSVSRMYQNTFVDSKKQSTIDILLGKDAKNGKPVKIYDPIYEFVHEKLKENSSAFTTFKDITMFVGTFNVSAASHPIRDSLDEWLFPAANDDFGPPEVYAIGLQELIELNAGAFLTADSSKPSMWGKILEKSLTSRGNEYLLLRTEAIASMSLYLFVRKDQVEQVTQVSGSSKKTGLGGMTANKGACAVRFDFGSTSFALVTSHLAAGVAATIERYNDYMSIMQGLTFTRNYTISDHDNVIWFGDLNYRIDLPNDRCRYLVESGAFDELSEADQLKKEMEKGGAFSRFTESPVKFYPTYKFDKGTSTYDSSEKQRVPSWTDRILFRGINPGTLVPLNYGSVMDIFLSDHKPVYSTFKVNIKFVNKQQKLALTKDYYNAYKKDYRSDQSLIEIDNSESSSVTSKSSNFTSDTLSEMNLFEDNASPPKLPSRTPQPRTVNTLPRRVPPPPMSRKAVASSAGLDNNNKVTGTNNLPQEKQLSTPPPPPPSRNSGPSRNNHHNLAFSAAPLVPSNSQPSTPRSMSPSMANTAASSPGNFNATELKPMKPSKPKALSAKKVDQVVSQPAVDPRKNAASPPPPPPPPRANTATSQGSKSTMMDWKPLIPQ
ncbi:Inositol-1,4,5-trisphosphate 5-phosphatase 1 [Candidozyma auris]|uniref:phosphoinositide 5-phosphatase n=1 Tax=Candidozyma auris TaxID=498019 RepID=A0A2H0ZGF1_CANAR|nr:hypothetical protein QG37_06912 [[Candida] auris]PIS49707.1 hypothetical protein B9J08_004734 [[Candida] auris]